MLHFLLNNATEGEIKVRAARAGGHGLNSLQPLIHYPHPRSHLNPTLPYPTLPYHTLGDGRATEADATQREGGGITHPFGSQVRPPFVREKSFVR